MKIAHDRTREPEARLPAYVLRSEAFARLRRFPVALHIYLVLVAHARKDSAWVSQRMIAQLAGTHRSAVQRAVAYLVADGWITKAPRFGAGPDGEASRLADEYTLAYPAELEECREQINLQLQGKSTTGVTSALFREGDLFAYKSGVYVRETRVPLSVLLSEPFSGLREHGQPLHLWLLLCAYSTVGERVSMARLALELHASRPRVAEGLAYLRGGGGHVWLESEQRSQEGSVHRVRYPVSAPPRPEANRDTQGEDVPQTWPDTPPPSDVMRELRWFLDGDETVHEMWRKAKEHDLLPKPHAFEGKTEGECVMWLVGMFHRAHRGVVDYLPTFPETSLGRELVRKHGRQAVDVVSWAVYRQKQTKFVPGSFLSIRPYLPEAVKRLEQPQGA